MSLICFLLFLAVAWARNSAADNIPQIESNEKYIFHVVPHSHMDLGWLSTPE